MAELILDRAREAGHTKVFPIGALSKGLAGEQLAELVALRDTGCVAFSNGLASFDSNRTLRRAMEYAATFNLTLVFHAQDASLADGGMAHEGATAGFLGLAGIPGARRPWPWPGTCCWWSRAACVRTSASSPVPVARR